MNCDNRIPPVVRRMLPGKTGPTAMSFLSFEDWLSKGEAGSGDWVVAAQIWEDDSGEFFTISAVASAGNEENLAKILSKHDWEIRVEDFGHPGFGLNSDEETLRYYDGSVEIIDEIEFRPIVIRRNFHNYLPARFELIQSFLLYHEAFFNSESNEYQRIDSDAEILPVVRVKVEANNEALLIERHHLRDYLAANKSYLVRYHDHKRASLEDISPLIQGESQAVQLSGEFYRYELSLRTDLRRAMITTQASHSRLVGKDIVIPYDQPDSRHTWVLTGEKKGKFEQFIIGKDQYGEAIEAICDHELLSDYYTDRGTPHFLTPVYFRKEVLKKYYDNPRLYSVEDRFLRCLTLWGIRFDVNDADLVYVWLGDLGMDLPWKEQLHWRQYNVFPEGGISDHRWKTDFLAQFAESNEPVHGFLQTYEAANSSFRGCFGFNLFLDLSVQDRYCLKTLHVPVTDEQKELDEQIHYLSKIVVDSLNKSALDPQAEGSIRALETFVASKHGIQTAKEIADALRMVQDLRSSGSAHRKGERFEACTRKYNLQNLTKKKQFELVLDEVLRALQKLLELSGGTCHDKQNHGEA